MGFNSGFKGLSVHLSCLRNAPRIVHLTLLDSIVPTVFFDNWTSWSCSVRNCPSY